MQTEDRLLRWRCVSVARFEEFAPRWQQLAAQRSTAPFLQLDFMQPLLRHFGNGRERLAVAQANEEILGLAVLAAPEPGQSNTFQPSQLPLGPIVLAENLCIETALTTLARQLPMTSLVVGLTQLDEAMYRRPAETPKLAVGSYIQTAWVDVEGTFASYWESRGKNLRQNMRKQRRKLEEDGIVARLEVHRDPAVVADAIEAYGQLEAAGWKSAGGTAIHPDNAQGRFYREMLERFCSNGRGCIYRYRFDDRVVAVDLCIESDDVLVILKTTYDESIKVLSPAFLMREEAFARIWQEGRIKRIEFFGKLMDWHKRWTENARDIYHLTHYRWSWIKSLRSRMKRSAIAQSQDPLSTQE